MTNTEGRVAGKVAMITGAARGQERAYAIRLAEEGADIIAVDICKQIATVTYPMPGPCELAATERAVQRHDQRAVIVEADVRDIDGLTSAVDTAVATLGRLDIVCANAGIASYGMSDELTTPQWQDVLDVNLTGVWNNARATTRHLIDSGQGPA